MRKIKKRRGIVRVRLRIREIRGNVKKIKKEYCESELEGKDKMRYRDRKKNERWESKLEGIGEDIKKRKRRSDGLVRLGMKLVGSNVKKKRATEKWESKV